MNECTYIDVGDPPESANHRRFRNRVTSVDNQSQQHDTCNGLGSGLALEHSSYPSKPCLHCNRQSEQENEERAVVEAKDQGKQM